MFLYKGAGPGTHWWTNDARVSGFLAATGNNNLNSMVRHITAFSHPSPYISFSASYAVACEYALLGPNGAATQAVPGYVYEIDPAGGTPALAASLHANLNDPAAEILRGNPAIHVAGLPTQHDGGQDLILGIASSLHASALTTPPRRPGAQHHGPPAVRVELRALIFALRDAEVLAAGNVPSVFVTNRYAVY